MRLGEAFEAAPRVSIDVALMEKTERAAVLPITYAWSDLGSWDAVWDTSEKDDSGNAIDGGRRGGRQPRVPGARRGGCAARGHRAAQRGGDRRQERCAGQRLRRRGSDEARPCRAGAGSPAETGRPGPPSSAGWSRWLEVEALPIWWSFGADHVHGGFQENLQETLRPTAANRRARVQARQVFVYALAGERGWPGPWRAAVEHGLDYLERRYRRADHLYRVSVTPLGEPVGRDSRPLRSGVRPAGARERGPRFAGTPRRP